MNYKPYKISAKKTALWLGSLMAAALVVGLILFFCLKFNDHKARLGYALEYVFDLVFVFFLFFCFTMNRIFYRALLQPQKIIYKDDSEEYHFQVNWVTHAVIWLISIIIFILVISCHSAGLHISWSEAAKKTAVVNVIIFVYNIVFMYLYIYILQYLLNNNESFKSELATFEKAWQEQQTEESKEA